MVACVTYVVVTATYFFFCLSTASSQSLWPVNGTTDLVSRTDSPRFLLSAGGHHSLLLPTIELALLSPDNTDLSYSTFLLTHISGALINVSPIDVTASDGVLQIGQGQIVYLSCDNEAATFGAPSALGVLEAVADASNSSLIIVYSLYSNHCTAENLNRAAKNRTVFTTVGSLQTVRDLSTALTSDSPGTAAITPDQTSYTVHPATASPTPIGLIVGASVGGVGGLAIVITIIYCILRRNRTKLRLAGARGSEEVSDKPEMYAGPVDLSIAGSVKPKHELQAKGRVQRKPLPSELRSQDSRPEKFSTTIEELESKGRSSGLYSSRFHELGVDNRTQNSSVGVSNYAEAGKGAGMTTDTSGSTQGSRSATYTTPNPNARTKPGATPSSAAEADLAVQELGLISMRKRALTEQAQSAGKKPEEMEGRAGEQFRDALEREEKLRRWLDEVHVDHS